MLDLRGELGAEADGLARAERVVHDRVRQMFEQSLLGLRAEDHARRDDQEELREIPALRILLQRLQHRLRERVADDRRRRRAARFDRRPQLLGVETLRGQRDDRAAAAERVDRREESRAVHQRAGRQQALAAPFLRDAIALLFDALARLLADHRVAAAAERAIERRVLPHHALRHARGAAGVHEEQIAGRALDVESLVGAGCRRSPRTRSRRRCPRCRRRARSTRAPSAAGRAPSRRCSAKAAS